jgi:hypothetical protein
MEGYIYLAISVSTSYHLTAFGYSVIDRIIFSHND